jgi:hypothetical protein
MLEYPKNRCYDEDTVSVVRQKDEVLYQFTTQYVYIKRRRL